ncbi:MAG: DUF4912 domain-containing protein [Prochlorococcus sp.]
MTQALSSMARLTLRQLRRMASELGVTLYSRKSKEQLLSAIALRQGKKEAERQSLEAQFSSPSRLKADTRVVFLPRDPQWAYVFWEISETDRMRALSKGANRLCIRLTDVTGINDNTAHPHTLQEVPVDSHSTEWYLPVPMGDRDYRVELGYRFGTSWMSLAFSSVARVPALQPSEQILDQFVPFSLEGITTSPLPSDMPTTPLVENDPTGSGLHERLYQSATKHFRSRRVGSEVFQEHSGMGAPASGLNDSGIGLWASGRNESGVGGVAPRQKTFWLVADAELMIYGATDPSARLTIGGENVPLSNDGTFRIQVPFRDGEQTYAIEATAADGEEKRNITLNFQRTTPKDNTNPESQTLSEWF